MLKEGERVWVITRGEYSDYGIDAVLIGPADAQMHLLKAAHEVARQTTTYRELGYRARRLKDNGFHLFSPNEARDFPQWVDEAVDSPRLDNVVDDYEWRRTFHVWLVLTQGFRFADHEEFHIED